MQAQFFYRFLGIFFILIFLILSSSCQITINGKPLFAETLNGVSKEVKFQFENEEFEEISFEAPAERTPAVSLVETAGVNITFHFLAESEGAFNQYINASSKEINGKKLKVHIGGPLYWCEKSVWGPSTTIKGVCLESIDIQLPRDGKTNIYVNGTLQK